MKFTYDNLETTSSHFHDLLFNQKEGEIGRKFLLNRNIGELENFKNYEIGYCPPDFPYPSAQSLYLDNKVWWMRGRLIITIRDQYNRIISFAGRMIEENKIPLKNDLFSKLDTPLLSYLEGNKDKLQSMVDDWETRKWVNEFYSKKDYLFGLNSAKRHIFDMGYAVIVEGYMDAIILWMNGFPNTVALCGTAMSSTHLALLRRYASHFVYCLDADKGGYEAIERTIKLICKGYDNFLTYYVVSLPLNNGKGLDPEDTIKNIEHKDIFLKAIKESSKRTDVNAQKKFIDLSDTLTRQILQNK